MNKATRRTFVQTSLAAIAANTSRRGLARAVPPSERIAVGFVGLGERGMHLLGEFLAEPDVQVVAVCDVEDLHYRDRTWGQGRALGRTPAVERIQQVTSSMPALLTADSRELLLRDDLDAVVVATPDHWHALCTVEAIAAGKDVYCEKPVTHHFAEGRAVCQAVKAHGAVFQTGSQQRSWPEFRRAVELVRNGVLGRLERIEVGLPPGYDTAMGDDTVLPPPDDAAYERWCGPALKLPYMRARHHRWWRGHSAYGGGVLMDWIGHHNDIAHWSLDLDNSGPNRVTAEGWTRPATEVYDTPHHYTIRCEYPGGVTSTISDTNALGTKWFGTNGWIQVTRGQLTVSDERWLAADFTAGAWQLGPGVGHVRNFLDSVKSRRPCAAPAHVGHRSITPGHLGFVSHAVGRSLAWDAANERIVDDPEAQQLLERTPYRAPWQAP